MLFSPTRGKGPESPPLHKEPGPNDLKFQETPFFVINLSYYFWLTLNQPFSPKITFSFKANCKKEKHHFNSGTNINCTMKTHPYGRS